MARVPVVELREMDNDFEIVPLARFVLTSGGVVTMVELEPGAQNGTAGMVMKRGLPERDRGLFPADGRAFLERLPEVFTGSRLWATPVFELEESEAMQAPDPKLAPRAPQRVPPPFPSPQHDPAPARPHEVGESKGQ